MTTEWLNRTHVGDCRDLMRQMIADGVKVQCIVTSPPYWGLRDYSDPRQFGLERTWIRHVARMRGVFRLARQLLTEDGLLWMNYGDSYANVGKWGGYTSGKHRRRLHGHNKLVRSRRDYSELKPKDLIGMPWRVAFALQHDGWYLRSDVIWHKPNPMPESMKDRPTKSHEYIFMFAASETYYYDQKAIREKTTGTTNPRGNGIHTKVSGWNMGGGSHATLDHTKAKASDRKFPGQRAPRVKQNASFSAAVTELVDDRNARTVWTIPTEGFEGAHFATFPQALVARCILAGSRPGDTVLDIFHGSGTVGKVATDLGRNFIGCELSQEYIDLHDLRRTTTGMPI